MADITHPTTAHNAALRNIIANNATEFSLHLFNRITAFNESLDDIHEVGVRLTSFGQTVIFRLESISCQNPSLIFLSGRTEEGDPVELIQHLSQVSILLMKIPRRHPEKPKIPIGFHAPRGEGADEQESSVRRGQ